MIMWTDQQNYSLAWYYQEDTGLRDYEVSLLRLVEKVTNGCVVQINETGTSVYYRYRQLFPAFLFPQLLGMCLCIYLDLQHHICMKAKTDLAYRLDQE